MRGSGLAGTGPELSRRPHPAQLQPDAFDHVLLVELAAEVPPGETMVGPEIRVGEPGAQRVAFEVVDREERAVAGHGQRLGVAGRGRPLALPPRSCAPGDRCIGTNGVGFEAQQPVWIGRHHLAGLIELGQCFGIAALLVAVIASAWMMAPVSKAQTGNETAATEAGMMDPLGLMKRAKDLPIHNILDVI